MTEVNPLLNKTIAGQIAQKLDAADGTKDGKINASIWNEFAQEHGGKTIKESIDVETAMNSITTYVVKGAGKAGKAVNDLAQEWLNKDYAPASGSGSAPVEGAGDAGGASAGKKPGEAGAAEGREKTDKTPAQTDYEGVRVTVPKEELPAPPDRTELNIVNKNRADGKRVAETLIQANNAFAASSGSIRNLDNYRKALKLITKDNVAYVCNHFPDIADRIDDVFFMGAGFDKDEVYDYVLKPLIEKASEYGYKKDNIPISQYYQQNDPSKLSLDEMKAEINELTKFIRDKDNETVHQYNKDVRAYNKEVGEVNDFNKNERSKAQKVFDEANKFLAEVANMNPKPEITSWHCEEEDYDKKKVKLPDGRWLLVCYDKEGEITKIWISHDTTLDDDSLDKTDVIYSKDKAWYDTDKNNFLYEGSITSGYDFEKLKALAEKIFG